MMHRHILDSLAQNFAMAAGACFIVMSVALDFVRRKTNACLAPSQRISWLVRGVAWKQIIAGYQHFYPKGWGYRIWRTSVIVWVVFVILAVLTKIFDALTS
jgi:hypothetical protein